MEKIVKSTWKNIIIVIVLFYVVGGSLFICGLLFGKGLDTYKEYRFKNSPEYLKQQRELHSIGRDIELHYKSSVDGKMETREKEIEATTEEMNRITKLLEKGLTDKELEKLLTN